MLHDIELALITWDIRHHTLYYSNNCYWRRLAFIIVIFVFDVHFHACTSWMVYETPSQLNHKSLFTHSSEVFLKDLRRMCEEGFWTISAHVSYILTS